MNRPYEAAPAPVGNPLEPAPPRNAELQRCPECGESINYHDEVGGPNGCTLTVNDVARRLTMPTDPTATAAHKRRERDRFCPHCDIDLGLHGTDDPEPDDCRYAANKANLLTSMDRLFGVRR